MAALGYLNELEKMGADVDVLNPHQATITGPTIRRSSDARVGVTPMTTVDQMVEQLSKVL